MAQSDSYSFQCPTQGCPHTYRARPEFAGKRMVCKGCQQRIQIPLPPSVKASAPSRASNRTGPSNPQRPVRAPSTAAAELGDAGANQTRCPNCGSVCRTRPDWVGREIQCPSCNKGFKLNPAVRATPTTPTHAAPPAEPPPSPVFDESDFGYEVVNEQAEEPIPLAPLPLSPEPPPEWNAPVALTPTTLSPTPVKKKKKRENSLQFLEDIVDSPKLLFLFGGMLALVLIVCGIFFAPLALGMRLIGGLFTAGGFIYALRVAFDENPSCGVFYLLDCSSLYRIYYTVTRWSDMKHAFFAEIFGLLLFVPWAIITTEDIVGQVPVHFNAAGMEEDEDPPFFNRQFPNPNVPQPDFDDEER
jgi:hypothetical protein